MKEMPPLLPGHKLILTLTLPSGAKMAVGESDGSLALLPINGGVVKGCMGFDSKDAIHKWLEEFRRINGPDKLKAILDLNPRIQQIEIAH